MIDINPAHKGKLHAAMGKPKGEKLSVSDIMRTKARAKKSGNVKLEREAVFAENARKWHHK